MSTLCETKSKTVFYYDSKNKIWKKKKKKPKPKPKPFFEPKNPKMIPIRSCYLCSPDVWTDTSEKSNGVYKCRNCRHLIKTIMSLKKDHVPNEIEELYPDPEVQTVIQFPDKRKVCENGHGFSEHCSFEKCVYCNTKLELRFYTKDDCIKNHVWFENTERKEEIWNQNLGTG